MKKYVRFSVFVISHFCKTALQPGTHAWDSPETKDKRETL